MSTSFFAHWAKTVPYEEHPTFGSIVGPVLIVPLTLTAFLLLKPCLPRWLLYLFVVLFAISLWFMDEMDGAIRRHWPPHALSPDSFPNQFGKFVVITGGNVGLGRSSAIMLAKEQATVVIGCRKNWEKTALEIAEEAGVDSSKVVGLKLDLSDSQSIREFAENYRKRFSKLDVLMMNAGIMLVPEFTPTKDGLESQLGVNWIGHFYLGKLLEDLLVKSAPSRIVVVSAKAHEVVSKEPPADFQLIDTPANRKNYGPTHNYGMSKLLNILYAKELSERLATKNVHVVSLHPGVVDTSLTRFMLDMMRSVLGEQAVAFYQKWLAENLVMTATEGALTQVWAATAPEIETDPKLQGAYLRPMARFGPLSPLAQDKQLQKRACDYS